MEDQRSKSNIPLVSGALSLADAATYLGGTSRATIYNLLRAGELASVKLGGRRLIPRQALDDLIVRKSAQPYSVAPSVSAYRSRAARSPRRA